ncbi:MAG: hypothetical protein J0J11_03685 [Microbacterium sp.]|nr:hypothetical protein [Microbacterium sp.]
MSSAEPLMPPHPQPAVTPADIDDDHDVDILPDGPAETNPAEEAPGRFPANPAFHTPVPGEVLTEDELEDDLGA